MLVAGFYSLNLMQHFGRNPSAARIAAAESAEQDNRAIGGNKERGPKPLNSPSIVSVTGSLAIDTGAAGD